MKNVDTYMYELISQAKKTSNKKVIAKKPLTNLYEINSTLLSVETDEQTDIQKKVPTVIMLFVVSASSHSTTTEVALAGRTRTPFGADTIPATMTNNSQYFMYKCKAF